LKKGIFLTATLIVSILFLGCTVANPNNTSSGDSVAATSLTQSQQNALNACDKMASNNTSTYDDYVRCYSAVATENPSACDTIYSALQEQVLQVGCNNNAECMVESIKGAMGYCYLDAGLKKQDTSLCSKALQLGYNKYNVYDCFQTIAVKTKNAAPCDLIDNVQYKGFCLTAVADASK
jgi:hypothetical protein